MTARFRIASIKLGARAYLQDVVVDRVAAHLETEEVFALTPKELTEKYGFPEILRDC